MVELAELLRERELFHSRRIYGSLTDKNGDFDSDNLRSEYQKFTDLAKKLLETQKNLSDLDIVQWHEVTGKLHPSKSVLAHARKNVEGPLMTQAWIKFYEILSNFPQLSETNLDYEPQLSSLHLCEAPGAFISALLQYCAGKEMLPPNWMAATLNPWHEESSPGAVINLDSLILAFPDRWIFGRDNTGDIFDKDYFFPHDHLKFSLVTSDGGFDCSADPEFQEINSSKLKEAEYRAICNKLTLGGCGVLKLFAGCHESTLRILESAANTFSEVYLTKPSSSKAGNSELYLVMLKFIGTISPLENTSIFLQNAHKTIAFFSERQENAIRNNLSFKHICKADVVLLAELQQEIDISTRNMLQKLPNITLEHPWKGMHLWSSYSIMRLRSGNLLQRVTRCEQNILDSIALCKTVLEFPRKKRINTMKIYFENFEFLCVPRLLTHISNSPFMSPIWIDRYNSMINTRGEWFSEISNNEMDHFTEAVIDYPECFINAISGEQSFFIGKDNSVDNLQYKVVVQPVTGSPFLPWSEITLRSVVISDLLIAFRKLAPNGGLILKCQYWTMCSRLMAQILAILTISFSSLEVHYVGDGTVLLWFRRIKEKERLNTCVILQTIYRKLSTEEVLECFPFHQLVENNWLTVLLRTFNDFMAESIIRAIVHFKHE